MDHVMSFLLYGVEKSNRTEKSVEGILLYSGWIFVKVEKNSSGGAVKNEDRI